MVICVLVKSWTFVVLYGSVWSCLVLHGSLGFCMVFRALFGPVWPCTTLHTSCIVLYISIMSCNVFYDRIWSSMGENYIAMFFTILCNLCVPVCCFIVLIATLGPNLQFQLELKSCLSWAFKLGHEVALLLGWNPPTHPLHRLTWNL